MKNLRSRAVRAWCGATIVALLAAFSAAIPAVAGPPFQTDDPEPTEYRHFEIYVFTQYAHQFDTLSGVLPAATVTYGLVPNVQIALTTPLAVNRASGSAPWMVGYGDTEFGVKMRFVQESSTRPQVAFYPAIVVPSGEAKRGLGGGFTKFFLPLWAQKSIGRWTVFGGGGLWHNPGPGNRDYTFSGIAVQREMSKRDSYGVEMFHASADTLTDRASTGFTAGYTRTIDDRHQVMISVGRSIGRSNALTTFFAYKLALGPNQK